MANNIKFCILPERDLPVINEVDLIIAGATLGSVSAALKAASMGAKVFVIGYLPYMGEDICGTYKYLFEDQNGGHPLLNKLFPKGAERTPFHVKKVLENELIDNNVDFLYSSYVTEVLFDDQSKPTGVIIMNRSGQQIIRGKVIIDATQGAYAAKLAGACFQEENAGQPQQFQFITVGNTTDPTGDKRLLPVSPKRGDLEFLSNEYTFYYTLEDRSYSSLCSAEQKIRGRVWDPDQVDAADHLFYVPPFKITGLQSYTDHLLKMDNLPLGVFVPNDLERMYVLGSCADISRAAVQDLLKPENTVQIGEWIGAAAAGSAKNMNLSSCSVIEKREEPNTLEGVLCVESAPVRPGTAAKNTIHLGCAAIPVIGEYEVAVMGGGTAGANAGIGAARNGAKTLVLEYLHGLGGTETMGRIGVYWDGYREGFTREVDKGVSEMAPADHPRQKTIDGHSNFDWKTEWYRRQIREAGGDIWFGVLGGGAYVEDGTVKGVLIASPQGMGIVLARVVIDSTGSGDIAIAAGAKYEYSDGEDFAVQGAGLPPVNLGDHYNNTDWTFIDDSDIYDVTRLYVSGKAKYDQVYDIGKLPQTRERRRIIGDHMVSVLDVINHRRYPDTISYHKSSFDTHGYTIDPYFTILPPEKRHTIYDADVPLRSLLPKGLDNIIVTGLGASAHRDAMPVIRMQPCLQNQGYSAGYLSALSVKGNCSVRQVDIKKVQAHLVEKDILPERVLTDVDNFPFTNDRLKEAVLSLPQDFAGLEVLLTNPQKAEELLLEAYSQSGEDSEKVVYAQVLCMLGNGVGMQRVIDSVHAYSSWDEGWDYTGMGQFGPCMSKLDSLIIALGETKQENALPAILEKAELLTPEHAFSHFRAISLACESIGSSLAVQILSELLDIEGVTGHHVTDLKHARDGAVPSTVDVSIRNKVLREIYLARALYRCGDDRQKGIQILENYRNDLHGHYFRHASGILRDKIFNG